MRCRCIWCSLRPADDLCDGFCRQCWDDWEEAIKATERSRRVREDLWLSSEVAIQIPSEEPHE